MKLPALIAALSLVGAGHAHKCYVCMGDNLTIDLPEGIETSSVAKSCSSFNPEKPDPSFEQECPLFHSGCMKLTDPNNPKNVMRSCFVLSQDTCRGPMCICDDELCNGSGQTWPSVAALLAGLAAALIGRH